MENPLISSLFSHICSAKCLSRDTSMITLPNELLSLCPLYRILILEFKKMPRNFIDTQHSFLTYINLFIIDAVEPKTTAPLTPIIHLYFLLILLIIATIIITVDYCHHNLPPLPSFVPVFAKKFTTLCQLLTDKRLL